MSKKTESVNWAAELDRRVNELSSQEQIARKVREGAAMAIVAHVRSLGESSNVSVVSQHHPGDELVILNDPSVGIDLQIYRRGTSDLIGRVHVQVSGIHFYSVNVVPEVADPEIITNMSARDNQRAVKQKIDRIMKAIINMVVEHVAQSS